MTEEGDVPKMPGEPIGLGGTGFGIGKYREYTDSRLYGEPRIAQLELALRLLRVIYVERYATRELAKLIIDLVLPE